MKRILLASTLLLAACSQADVDAVAAPQDAAEAPTIPNITSQDLGNGFYVLLGPGGNIGVSIGADGVYIIDDKFARFGQEIIDVIATLSDQPITYVLNTHHHGDHTGANAEMRAVGATILAHDNVRKRMSRVTTDQETGARGTAREDAAWPTLTYSENMTLWFNGDEVRAIHTPSGHTDGDTIVQFVGANIMHLGDNFFYNMLPFIDVDSGGSIQGMIAAQQMAFDAADANTVIIPGHGGATTTKAELGESIKRLQAIHDRVKARKDAGESLEAIIAADPLADMTELESFMKKENVIRAAYRTIE